MTWFRRLYPFILNVLIVRWVYLGIQQHNYAKVAAWVVFILFCECDHIKNKLESQNDRIHARGGRVRRYGINPATPNRRRGTTWQQGHESEGEADES